MSILVMAHVWQNAKARGTELLLLLAIADHAHDDGGGAYPSVARLAERTRMDQRSVQRLIKELVALGELEVQRQKGPKGVNLYAIPMGVTDMGVTDCRGGDKTSTLGVTPLSPGTVRGTVSKPLASKAREGKKPRPPDPIWDALVEVFKTQPQTRAERGKWNAVVAQLREIGATPSQIRARAGAWKSIYPNAKLTPFALVNHWSALGPAEPPHVQRLAYVPEPEPDFKANVASIRQLRQDTGL